MCNAFVTFTNKCKSQVLVKGAGEIYARESCERDLQNLPNNDVLSRKKAHCVRKKEVITPSPQYSRSSLRGRRRERQEKS